jgi:hypothetical protein
MHIAKIDRSTPAIEAKLPRDVPILRERFTAEQLCGLVNQLFATRAELGKATPPWSATGRSIARALLVWHRSRQPNRGWASIAR